MNSIRTLKVAERDKNNAIDDETRIAMELCDLLKAALIDRAQEKDRLGDFARIRDDILEALVPCYCEAHESEANVKDALMRVAWEAVTKRHLQRKRQRDTAERMRRNERGRARHG